MNGSTLDARLNEIERTPAWLATKLGVAPSTVTRWIHGAVPIPEERVPEIESILEQWAPRLSK